MTRKTIILVFILVQSALYGQTLLSKKLIDIKTNDYWTTVSKNDTLLNEYSFLDSLNFYAINYLSDTLKINGFLIEPKNGNKLPTIIFNRGGNREFGALTIGLLIEWVAPIAKEGYIIVASQYRGNSGSEGKDEFGGQDVNDVLNLIPIIDNMPRADTTRIGMYGWSRGGIMTYLALTKTNRIKAAIIGGAPTDLLTLLDKRPEMEKVYNELIPGYLTNKTTELKNRSAIYWTDKLCRTTSYFILHGKNDSRVDYSQATNIVSKLKMENIKVENVFYDNADHIINEYRADKDAKILSWLKQNL
jgi:dipeptidyl aminopeptidase/acylaminoacyl peptidase